MSGEPSVAIAVPAEGAERRYANYFQTVRALGGRPAAVGADVDPRRFGALLLPGGYDVDPARYGRENVACGQLDPALDALQLAALDAFVGAKRPVFGICRGHQLLNVYFGGTLIQHLPQSARHKWDEATGADRAHGSEAAPGSWLAALYGASFPVNSAHHQGVETLGGGLVVDQRADDGVIEAMHHAALPVWCVQWHPERMCLERARADTVDGAAVIRWFLEKAVEHSKRKRIAYAGE